MVCFFQVSAVCWVLGRFIGFSIPQYEQLKRFSTSELPESKVMRSNEIISTVPSPLAIFEHGCYLIKQVKSSFQPRLILKTAQIVSLLRSGAFFENRLLNSAFNGCLSPYVSEYELC